MRIAIGTDHRGLQIKKYFMQNFTEHAGNAIEWVDVGCNNELYCDYPLYAIEVAQLIRTNKLDHGVLICGSGIGMAIAANRFTGVLAGLVWNEEVARLAREHDNVNVLVLPSDFIDESQAHKMVDAWLSAKFLGGKYQTRIDMIDGLTQ